MPIGKKNNKEQEPVSYVRILRFTIWNSSCID